jgi:2-oxo-4-hydroxy-4-carboxy-5-ureidoimidazoline decarboxylase
VSVLDGMSARDAEDALTRCCGAARWVRGMLERRPFDGTDAVLRAADEVWASMDERDILDAFAHHPRIGADMDELKRRFASTSGWASGEQAGARGASEETLRALRDGNLAYEARFGFIFIVCATGKGADEMLALLTARIGNPREDELRIAAGEQAKITRIRLAKLEENA